GEPTPREAPCRLPVPGSAHRPARRATLALRGRDSAPRARAGRWCAGAPEFPLPRTNLGRWGRSWLVLLIVPRGPCRPRAAAPWCIIVNLVAARKGFSNLGVRWFDTALEGGPALANARPPFQSGVEPPHSKAQATAASWAGFRKPVVI